MASRSAPRCWRGSIPECRFRGLVRMVPLGPGLRTRVSTPSLRGPRGRRSTSEAVDLGVVQGGPCRRRCVLTFHVQSPRAPPQRMCPAAVKAQGGPQTWPGRTSRVGPGTSQASGNPKKTVCMGVNGSVQAQATHMYLHSQNTPCVYV